MYCKDCDTNWEYIPGKRSFRNERALLRDTLCLVCPECREPEEDRQARKHNPLVGRNGQTGLGAKRRSPDENRTLELLEEAGLAPEFWTIIDPSQTQTKEIA